MARSRKPMCDSCILKENIVLPADTNTHGTLFGGVLMKHIDEVAAIAALRHCRTATVTASNDGVHFHRPIQMGHILILEAYVSAVGRSSMEVFVKIITEDSRNGQRQVAAVSFLTFVALDDDGRPIEVPDVYPESEEEHRLYRDRHIRKAARDKKRHETNDLIQSLSARFRIMEDEQPG